MLLQDQVDYYWLDDWNNPADHCGYDNKCVNMFENITDKYIRHVMSHVTYIGGGGRGGWDACVCVRM